jgi:hypothetical protein
MLAQVKVMGVILALVAEQLREQVSPIKHQFNQPLQHLHGIYGRILLQIPIPMFLWDIEAPHLYSFTN